VYAKSEAVYGFGFSLDKIKKPYICRAFMYVKIKSD